MEKKNFFLKIWVLKKACVYNPTVVAVCYDADLLNAFF